MITLIQGVPGAGKTLYALRCIIEEVLKIQLDKEGNILSIPDDVRPLISVNLKWDVENPNVKLLIDENILRIINPRDLQKGEGESFQKKVVEETQTEELYCTLFPTGALVICDELQKFFPKRASGKAVPLFIEWFQTHRHWGNDVFIMTQDAMLIDDGIRRLVGDFRHLIRVWGLYSTNVFKFSTYQNTTTKSQRAAGVHETFEFDKRFYGWYKSSEVHTHKRKIPAKVWKALIIFPILFIALAFILYYLMRDILNPDSEITQQTTESTAQTPSTESVPTSPSPPSTPPPPPPPPSKPNLPIPYEDMELTAVYKVGVETRIIIQIQKNSRDDNSFSDNLSGERRVSTTKTRTFTRQQLELLGYNVIINADEQDTPHVFLRHHTQPDHWQPILFNPWQ